MKTPSKTPAILFYVSLLGFGLAGCSSKEPPKEKVPFEDGTTLTYSAGIMEDQALFQFTFRKSGGGQFDVQVTATAREKTNAFNVTIDENGRKIKDGKPLTAPMTAAPLWMAIYQMPDDAKVTLGDETFRLKPTIHWKDWDVRPLVMSMGGGKFSIYYHVDSGYLVGHELATGAGGMSCVLTASNVPGLVRSH